ncbi:ActS/PrrB/RegB family redox-sensitive histidine kinase [Paracoccus sp. 11-3]|uniref:histidine kinase n=1 Tax=Paracoccus amoyensis TaxID=2760093 RepID=A0A926GLT4_9RHOB|nr:ActS/PrrB/RegB family redox-sensitive histidine kinase [Paracoccus amoyensis]MBC9246290.1 ActS/PrrB/RegB family redox-sensitive histidine kinase [Paracoccus amoyensis]
MTKLSPEIATDSFLTPELEPVRLRTLVLLRWFAISGQLAAVMAARVMGIQFPIAPVSALIAAAAIMNLWQMLKPQHRMSASQTTWQLTFDLVQISALMALTGGLSNPFALLVLAPVMVAATALNNRRTIALGLATIILISLASILAMPLHDAAGNELRMAPVLTLGHWVALVIGVVFFASYARRVSAEINATSTALFATQMALLREQRLQHLGGVVAAAAHEMGTPLATIKLIAGELSDELGDRSDLHTDMVALRESVDRCAQILRSMGRAGKEDLHLRSAPIRAVLEDAANPHANRGPVVEIRGFGPEIRRDPGIIHALRNLIQNAVDFARTRVVIEVRSGDDQITVTIRDDGPGYSPAMLARIGDPFVTSRRTGQQRNGYDGMGLGLFIAKTLLERSGAALTFANGGPGAVVTVRWQMDRIGADSRIPLGENPSFDP